MADAMIEAKSLSKRYGDVRAVNDVSFTVNKGEVVGFLGPNGAGKSTTMRILTCFLAPTEGTASVNGADIFDDPIKVRESIGYLPESTPLYTEMLVLEYLEYVAELRGYKKEAARKQIRRAVEQTSLEDVIGKEIRALSKGYRQRVGLAQALVHEPPILILDEPLSGLDPNQAEEIRDLIREIGHERTVILSTHNLSEVQQTCGRVLIISGGELKADDTPEELRTKMGAATYYVTLSQTGDKEEVLEALRKVDGVRHARFRAQEGDELQFSVSPKSTEDLRAELFRAAVDQKWTMLGLRREALGLAEVFRQLTTGDAESIRQSDAGAKGAEAEAKNAESKNAESKNAESKDTASKDTASKDTEAAESKKDDSRYDGSQNVDTKAEDDESKNENASMEASP